MTNLRDTIAALKGNTALVETTAGGWGDRGGQPQGDWKPRRIGADLPDALIQLREGVEKTVCVAAGVPPGLISTSGQASMQREAWRQFLHGSVEPLSKTVSAEFTAKLDSDIRLDFHNLFASDLQGRARAYQSMTNGEKGIDKDAAARICGLTDGADD